MKKIFISILFVAITVLGYGQLSVGLRGGYGTHGVYFEHTSLNKNQVPFLLPNAGLVISFNNELNTGLQTEVNYTQKGWREEVDSTDAFFERKIDYLEIPFFSHFEIGHGKVRPVIMIGPYFGFKLKESMDSSNYTYITDGHPYNHFYQDIRDMDFGIKLALGLRYNPTPKFGLFIEARYDIQAAGGRDIFFDRPNEIKASRLKEFGGTFGVLWHIIPQKLQEDKKGYIPKQDLHDEY